MSRARVIAAFFMLGALLLGLRALSAGRETVEVTVPADADAGARDAAVVDALLEAEARRLRWHRTDPVVARVLVDAVRAVGRAGEEDALLAHAYALGLDRTDPLVRARLLDRARRAALPSPPDEATLAAHLAGHADRFRAPDRLEVRVAHTPTPPEEATAPASEVLTLGRLSSLHGARVAAAAAAAPLGQWAGPVQTVRGPAWVFVEARHVGEVPPLAEVRARVLQDWIRAAGAALAVTDAIRERYTVRIVER